MRSRPIHAVRTHCMLELTGWEASLYSYIAPLGFSFFADENVANCCPTFKQVMSRKAPVTAIS